VAPTRHRLGKGKQVANWHDILNEITQTQQHHAQSANSAIDTVRRKYLKQLADLTGRNVIAYYSGWLSKGAVEGIDITDEDINSFMSCINGMDRSKGLDLILHTPGGGIAATEAIVQYLRAMFGKDIRAIVPQIAMSAGTMVALSCRSILMGRPSSLGPIDPQLGGIPADVVLTEFERAYQEIKADPVKAHVWAPVLSRYTPSFLTQCEYATSWSKTFVKDMLTTNMFEGAPDADAKASAIVNSLSSASINKAHNKHIHLESLTNMGIIVERLEDNQKLQDAVLTVHHAYMHTLSGSSALKITENDDGRAVVKHLAQQAMPMSFTLGGPSQ